MVRKESRPHNSTNLKGGVSCSKDSFVVNQTLVIQIKFSGKNPAHRKSAKRWAAFIFSMKNTIYLFSVVLIFVSCNSSRYVIHPTADEYFSTCQTLEERDKSKFIIPSGATNYRIQIDNYQVFGKEFHLDTVLEILIEDQTEFIQLSDEFGFKAYHAETKEFESPVHLHKIEFFFKYKNEWKTTQAGYFYEHSAIYNGINQSYNHPILGDMILVKYDMRIIK